ncbi:hypothetical protein [Sphingomonas sp. RB1R13]|uniref:hypothetical protein n=1 Tax=Sphingomonas sp. RB1R13 TaxID=3096159 RepID=UPI002FCC1001
MPDKPFTFFENSNMMLNMGVLFVTQLHEDSKRVEAPARIVNNWKIMANFLGHQEGELQPEHIVKIEEAWSSYLASGVAPSLELQSVFSPLTQERVRRSPKGPPPEIREVFDRLLATDEKIAEKRIADGKPGRGNRRGNINFSLTNPKVSWWRRQSAVFRFTVFSSGAWISFMQVYARIFDPFHVGGWDAMGDGELMKLEVISIAPIVIAALYWAYGRWVR